MSGAAACLKIRVLVLAAAGAREEVDVQATPDATVSEFETGLSRALAPHKLPARSQRGRVQLFFRGHRINDCGSNTLSAWKVGSGAVMTALFASGEARTAATAAATIDLSQDDDDGVALLDDDADDDDSNGGDCGVASGGDSVTAGGAEPPRAEKNPLNILQHHLTFQDINSAIHGTDWGKVERLLNSANTPAATGTADGPDDLRHIVVEQPSWFVDVVVHTTPVDLASTAASVAFVVEDDSDGDGDDSGPHAGDAVAGFDITPATIQQLCGLGFSADAALEALQQCHGDADAAANRLFDLT